jgi:DNA-binding NarL/FixJ family response regulator
MNKLIAKAKETRASRRRVFTTEEIELAQCFVQGLLSVSQVAHALGVSNKNSSSIVYQFVAQALRQYYSK